MWFVVAVAVVVVAVVVVAMVVVAVVMRDRTMDSLNNARSSSGNVQALPLPRSKVVHNGPTRMHPWKVGHTPQTFLPSVSVSLGSAV